MAKTATAARPRYSESLHVLVDRPTREIILGLAINAAEQAGTDRPKEGEAIRDLLTNALDDIEKAMSKRAFAELRARGAAALADRDAKLAMVGKAVETTPLAPIEA